MLLKIASRENLERRKRRERGERGSFINLACHNLAISDKSVDHWKSSYTAILENRDTKSNNLSTIHSPLEGLLNTDDWDRG